MECTYIYQTYCAWKCSLDLGDFSACVRGVFSPLPEKWFAWEALLQPHPDQQLKEFVLRGLKNGFHIRYNHEITPTSATHNLLLCIEHPEVVQEYIDKEHSLGRLLGPFPQQSIPNLQVNPFGVIPKIKASSKWQLIVDLSAPHSKSVNDGITPEYSSLSYVTVDVIVDRVIPVYPADRILLGMQWRGSLYINTVLPFRLRSAPKLFNIIADAVHFIAHSQGVQHITHHLDDYIILGRLGLEQCGTDLRTLNRTLPLTGSPLADEKIEVATELEILGIKVDSVAIQLSVLEHKM